MVPVLLPLTLTLGLSGKSKWQWQWQQNWNHLYFTPALSFCRCFYGHLEHDAGDEPRLRRIVSEEVVDGAQVYRLLLG